MGIIEQIFYWCVILSLFIEVVLALVFLFFKERLTSEEARSVFVKNIDRTLYIGGLFLGALLLHVAAEFLELFEVERGVYVLMEVFHTTFLISALVLMAALTLTMGWKR